VSFEDYIFLPTRIKEIEKKYHFFEVRACEDIKSYKKIIPTIEAFPNSYIVTADDDIFYPKKWLYYLAEEIGDEKIIIAHRAHSPVFSGDHLDSYENWNHNINCHSSGLIVPTGIGGILYSPGSLPEETINKNNFMKLAQTADDLWLFWMGRRNNAQYILTKNRLNFVAWHNSHHGGLAEINVEKRLNDKVILNLENEYGCINKMVK